jgi:succinate dehydrogenase hydrophobic anchor subunit
VSFDVFISHSSKDTIAAKAACAALEAAKIRCWIAPRDIVPGAKWGASIVRAINDSRVMVLIFSGNANSSAQVQREVDQAFGKSKTVVPLRIEDVRPADELAYYLDTVHWLDALTPPLEHNLERLVATVRALLPTTEETPRGGEPVIDEAEAARAQEEARAADEERERKAAAGDAVEDASQRQSEAAGEQGASAADAARLSKERGKKEEQERRRADENAIDVTASAKAASTARPIGIAASTGERKAASDRWAWLDYVTTFFLWAGTLLFAWGLIAASAGPAAYAYVQWLSRELFGQLVFGCYFVSILASSLRRIFGMMRGSGFADANSSNLLANTVNYAAIANVLLGSWLTVLLTFYIYDRPHPEVVQIFSWPAVAIPTMIFAASICIQMNDSLQRIIARHLPKTGLRIMLTPAIAFSAIATAVAIVYGIIGIEAEQATFF